MTDSKDKGRLDKSSSHGEMVEQRQRDDHRGYTNDSAKATVIRNTLPPPPPPTEKKKSGE